jgi:rare lipoprotein A
MSKWPKRIFLLVLWIFVLDVVISWWILLHDLKVRFPEADFSRARFGVASWYSRTDKHIQEYTASHEKFDDKKMTCASWDYPFGQRLAVINVVNGKWITCRVNDRGPNKRLRRQVDLTRAAFAKIRNPKHGLAYVTIVPAGRYKILKTAKHKT